MVVANARFLVAVIAIVMTVLFAPLRLLYLDLVFHFYYVFGALYLWTVVMTDVVNYLVGLVLQL